ncbi:MAG: hypothetical protein ACREO5_11550 [Candidatus Binatia bacterium]
MITYELHGMMDWAYEHLFYFSEILRSQLNLSKAAELLLAPADNLRVPPEVYSCFNMISKLRTELDTCYNQIGNLKFELERSSMLPCRLENAAVAQLSKVLPAKLGRATKTDGVSFHTVQVRPKNFDSYFHIEVNTCFCAPNPNTGVVAVFVGGQSAPFKIASKPVADDRREHLGFGFDVPANGTQTIHFDFRIGPGEPGIIVFNGPEGDVPSPTTVTIAELIRPRAGESGPEA